MHSETIGLLLKRRANNLERLVIVLLTNIEIGKRPEPAIFFG